jgi:hypothetical protein
MRHRQDSNPDGNGRVDVLIRRHSCAACAGAPNSHPTRTDRHPLAVRSLGPHPALDLPALAGVPVREGRLQEGVSTAQLGPDPIDFSQLFQPRLIRVLEVSSEAKALSVGGTRYLFPFDQKILDHLSPTDLMDRVTAESSGFSMNR